MLYSINYTKFQSITDFEQAPSRGQFLSVGDVLASFVNAPRQFSISISWFQILRKISVRKNFDFKSATIFEKMKVSQAVLLLASNSAAVQQVVDKTRQLDIELSVDDSSRSGNFLILFPKSSLMWSWIHRELGEYLVGKFQRTSWYYHVNVDHEVKS